MKPLLLLLLIPLNSLGQLIDYASPQEFFDDFSYSDYQDSEIASFGWDLMNRPGWPGYQAPVMYAGNNITFVQDPEDAANTIMKVATSTTNNLADRSFARIQYSTFEFLHGTYAARVKFDNIPSTYGDGNVQTFYAIFNAENDPSHAEIDFEYLSYDVWGGGNTNHGLYMTTWESYINEPWTPMKAFHVIKEDHADVWHDLIFVVQDSNNVTYYLDGSEVAFHTVADQDGTTSVYPDSKMQIAFANWIWSNATTGIGTSTDTRQSTMEVDWVYHSNSTSLSTEQVSNIVNQLRDHDIDRTSSMTTAAIDEVSYFELTRTNDELHLTWQNPFESDISRQILEYAADGINFSSLFTAVNSNNNLLQTYNFTDADHLQGYYRIRTEFNGGVSSFSDTLYAEPQVTSVGGNFNTTRLAYPNPTTGMINLSFLTSWEILNSSGDTLLHGEGQKVDMSHLNPGLYILKLPNQSIKIQKQ